MKEVFTIDGETLDAVKQTISECKNKILGGMSTSKIQNKENSLKDVDVEVLSYKSIQDNHTGEVLTTTQAVN